MEQTYRKKPLFLIILLMMVSLVSCRDRAIDEEIAGLQAAVLEAEAADERNDRVKNGSENIPQADEKTEPSDIPVESNVDPDTQELTKSENVEEPSSGIPKEQSAPTLQIDYEGILSSEYVLHGNNYYFSLRRQMNINHRTTGVSMPAIYNIKAKQYQILCPDPLCKHNDYDLCKYIGLDYFCAANERTLYASRSVSDKYPIVKCDLNKDQSKVVYDPVSYAPSPLCVDGNVFYLTDCRQETSNRKTVYHNFLVGLDVNTDETISIRNIPEDVQTLTIYQNNVICTDAAEVWFCNMNFENKRSVIRLSAGEYLGAWYYDTNVDEFYFSIINQEMFTGKIYKYKNGECCPVDLPEENIYYFQLTNSKIYYTAYNLRVIGPSVYGDRAVDYSEGKIYSVSREKPDRNPVLVYESPADRLLCRAWVANYSIFDDQLFYSEIQVKRSIVNGIECVDLDISQDLPKIHVDLTTGEEEIIRFE